MSPKARRWCFTTFDIANPPTRVEDVCTYLLYGKERAPSTGKLHYQCYAEYSTPVSRTRASRAVGVPNTTHFETCKGNQASNIAYCKKEGDWKEDGAPKKQGKRNDLEELKTLVDERKPEIDLWEAQFGSMVRYHKGISRYRMLREETRKRKPPKVYFLYGPPGSGKTRMAVRKGGAFVEFNNGGFIQGYRYQEKVIIDDIRPETFQGKENVLLRLLDRYKYTANVKGGSVAWNPTVIFLTSNYTLEELFPERTLRKAIKRRITRGYRFNDLHSRTREW